MAATNTYDAVIVGSGITGGWAAKELTEKGLRVLVLEAGRTILPERDYVEHVPVLLRLRRIFQQIFRQRQGKSVFHRSQQEIYVDSRPASGREIHHLGPAELPLE
jgi:choline dehydrogenase-like flavoprotein